MAQARSGYRDGRRWALAALVGLSGGLATAQLVEPAAPAAAASVNVPASAASATAAAPGPRWLTVPRSRGRLHAADIGLVINTEDPYSVQVGEHYIALRGLLPDQVLRLAVPAKPTLTRAEFEALQQSINAHFGDATQALALAWVAPYAVECNSITGALALGFDAELCKQSCAASRQSRYFNSASARPYAEHGWRPSMLLAANSVAEARALIERGVAADGSLLLRGRPPVNALFLTTDDVPRRVRTALYPPPGQARAVGVNVLVVPEAELTRTPLVLLATTGSVRPGLTPAPAWVPGGLGDHLTSFGGAMLWQHGQSTVLDWIASGATASQGSVTEPCNHLQKFPHPQVLLLHYLQGSTALEAYWKSVAWPQQALFVGEPLAAPFAAPFSRRTP